jgi:hypothetical protein
MDPAAVAQSLQSLATDEVARKRCRHIRPLRGIRGVPEGELGRFLHRTWEATPPALPRDDAALRAMFGSAWEDGLVAIGLAASCLGNDPAGVLALGLDWLEQVDDVATADALGWLVLGPSSLATDRFDSVLDETAGARHPAVRRAGVIMGMALLPTPIQGPAAAALRATLGTREGRIVEAPRTAELCALGNAFARDEEPAVRKGLRRVLGTWADHDATAAKHWMEGVPGGVHRMLRDEIESTAARNEKRAARRAAR